MLRQVRKAFQNMFYFLSEDFMAIEPLACRSVPCHRGPGAAEIAAQLDLIRVIVLGIAI